ncbi:MAG TPA: zinc ribbon domain-containing protein [Candidatus Limnocylindrales bacterium]|nr:zinc ribbon domain-containing protein [Candidatus Limnocylindrales bacterium]
MPIYDYTCSACGHLTEVVHGIHDHGPRFCPECGAEGTMTKAFAPPTIHFKGSGWAKKDRSSSSRSSDAKKDESAAKTGTGTADGGSGPSGSGSGGSGTGATGSDGGGSAAGGTSAPASSGD